MSQSAVKYLRLQGRQTMLAQKAAGAPRGAARPEAQSTPASGLYPFESIIHPESSWEDSLDNQSIQSRIQIV